MGTDGLRQADRQVFYYYEEAPSAGSSLGKPCDDFPVNLGDCLNPQPLPTLSKTVTSKFNFPAFLHASLLTVCKWRVQKNRLQLTHRISHKSPCTVTQLEEASWVFILRTPPSIQRKIAMAVLPGSQLEVHAEFASRGRCSWFPVCTDLGFFHYPQKIVQHYRPFPSHHKCLCWRCPKRGLVHSWFILILSLLESWGRCPSGEL